MKDWFEELTDDQYENLNDILNNLEMYNSKFVDGVYTGSKDFKHKMIFYFDAFVSTLRFAGFDVHYASDSDYANDEAYLDRIDDWFFGYFMINGRLLLSEGKRTEESRR